MPGDLPLDGTKYRHGTRARYVFGRCRCSECRAANVRYYHQRQRQRADLSQQVKPTGPAGTGTLRRGGVDHQVRTCPGANGEPCCAKPSPRLTGTGAWLRGPHDVCGRCVERATTGLVPSARARRHLLQLSRLGVGYKAVAAASDVAASGLSRILSGEAPKIRADVERRILEVDAGAKADHAIASERVTFATVNTLEALNAAGFTKAELARLLGSQSRALQVGRKHLVLEATAGKVARLWRRYVAGELKPSGPLEAAAPMYAILRNLVAAGLDQVDLTRRLGFHVNLAQVPKRIRRVNADAVRELVGLMDERRREGDGLPEGWEVEGNKLAGLEYDGWSLERRTSKRAQRREAKELRALARRGAA